MHKVDELGVILANNYVHIACVTESWLNDRIPSDIVDIPGYLCYRHDRGDGRRGGGVVCYVREDVPCHRLTEFECRGVESLWLLYRNKRMPRTISHVLIGVIYYPPNGDSWRTLSNIMDVSDIIKVRHPPFHTIHTGKKQNFQIS